MKKQQTKTKTARKINWRKAGMALGTILVAIGFIILLGASAKQLDDVKCQSVRINIDHASGNYFLQEADIEAMILDRDQPLEGLPVRTIDLEKMEQAILQHNYVERAELFVDSKGGLYIDIIQKEPILRVINKKGVSYYIDKNGNKLPTSYKFTSRVAVCTGHIQDNGKNTGPIESETLLQLFELGSFIHRDEFWKAQVEQVYVNDKGEFEIIPRLGNHTIEFGGITRLEEKFNKLGLFYKQGLRNVGWTKYKTINLKYKDQIVCKKR